MAKVIMLSILVSMVMIMVCNHCSAEIIVGYVRSTQDSKLYVANGETIVVSLGRKDGVLKGDILTLIKRDGNFKRKAGSCLVISAEGNESVCRILRTDTEIGIGDEIEARETIFLYPELKEPFLTFFSEIVRQHNPEKGLSVFATGIFDNGKNVTAFSKRIASELNNFLSSKRIFIVQKEDRMKALRDLVGYPDEYFPAERNSFYIDEVMKLKGIMRNYDLDVLIMGSYREEGSRIIVTLYSVDRSFGERKMEFDLPLEKNLPLTRQIVEPYSPKVKKNVVQIHLSLERRHFYPTAGEQKRISQDIAQKDPDFRYAVLQRKISFDRISPEGIQIVFDGRPTKVIEGKETVLDAEEGTHTLHVSFFPGFFFGPELVYALKQRETKEAILEVKGSEKGPLFVEIRVSTEPRSEKISLDVYRRADTKKSVLRTIAVKKTEVQPVEVYVE